MPPPQSQPSSRLDLLQILPRVLAKIVLALTALNLVAITFRFGFGRPMVLGFVPLFYLDYEANVPTWYSSAAWLIAGGAAAQIAVVRYNAGRDEVRPWWVVAVLCFLLSMDEIAGLHELPIDWLREQQGFRGPLYYGWVVPGAIFFCVVGLSMLRFWLGLPRTTQRLTLAAGCTFLAGAIGVEMLSGMQADAYGEENLGYALIITIEELLEMGGVVMLVSALCAHLRGEQAGEFATASREARPTIFARLRNGSR